MSIRDNEAINPYLHQEKEYNLAIKHLLSQTSIKMTLKTPFYHTLSLPMTYRVLDENLPSVLKTECFNDSGLPFHEEVKNTEIGHLFEHIILEYLCQLKIKQGHQKALFKGVTNWNWRIDAKGTFHIFIDLEPKDVIFLDIAIEKSIKLLNKILEENKASLN